MSFEDIEDENEGRTLMLNEKGELEEFKEEDYDSVPRKHTDLIQAFIDRNQDAFTAPARRGRGDSMEWGFR